MGRVFRVRLFLLVLSITFFALGVTAAQATVETGWPDGTPNVPRYADDVFLDFEAGIDRAEIESSIPSLKFTTTSGLNWRYADTQTGVYNVHPYGEAAYETNGNVFAWLGQTGNEGRIDFLGGGATYCSVLVSTSSGLIIDAYDSTGTKIADSGWAGDNTFSRTFTRLTVDAPAGKTIAYVVIHDTGNFWLIDDLCTDANKSVIPLPGRALGSHGDKFDLVFVPDTDYGTAADVDTWLATFVQHINDQIDQRLGAADPVTGNLCKFNFYYTKLQGTATSKTLPANLTLLAPFADAYVIFHNTEFGDSTSGNPPVYGAEGPVGRSFIHESGHGIFGLADEYDDGTPCYTTYFQPDPNPNIWATEALGRADATSEGWDPDEIWKFTDCQDDWWKLGTTEYIMLDGTRFANGWGPPAERRIQWFLDQLPTCSLSEPASPAERAVWLGLHVSSGAFSLLDDTFVLDSPPNYIPGQYGFTAEVFTTSGAPAGHYGVRDPREVFAEQGYTGPAWLVSTDFSVVLPYFSNGGRVDLTESETGELLISVDISRFVDPLATPPVVDAGPDQTVDEAAEVSFSGTATDPGGDPMTYEWDFGDGTTASGTLTPTHTYGDDGTYTVRLTVTDNEPAVSVDYLTVTVQNVDPTLSNISLSQSNAEFILPVVHTVSLSADSADPGSDDATFIWDLGDGTVATNVFYNNGVSPDPDPSPDVNPMYATGSTSHAWAAPGDYTVNLTVTDDDGGTSSTTILVQVRDAAGALDIMNGYVQGLPDSAFKEKAAVRKAAIGNMVVAWKDMYMAAEYQGLIQSLTKNLREKADGTLGGQAANDWVVDAYAQTELCQKIDDITAYVTYLLSTP